MKNLQQKSAVEQLEEKALSAQDDCLKYEKFNDLGEILTPNQRGRLDGAASAAKLAINQVYNVLSDIQLEIEAQQ